MADEQVTEAKTPVVPAINRESNGKDALGRFVKGHKLAHGNQSAMLAQKYRGAWAKCIKPQHVKAVYQKLYDLAMTGDIPAVRLWLEYGLGKPQSVIEVEDAQGNQSVLLTL